MCRDDRSPLYKVDYFYRTALLLIIFECQFQMFQRFSSSNLVLKPVKSRFLALNYY
jgi:hypothetical protein